MQGWDTLPDGSNVCAAPRFSMVKWESELTTAQRSAWQTGQPFDLNVTSGSKTYPVKVVAKTVAAKGSVMLPGGFRLAPYNLNNVVTVAGSDSSGKMWVDACPAGSLAFATALGDTKPQICGGSTYGSHVNIAAPSKDILAQALGLAVNMSGTSFGSPIVASAAGVALTVNPSLTAPQLKAAITSGVNPSRIKPGLLTGDDILKMPRMLAASPISVPDPLAPTRLGVLSSPTFNATARTYAFSESVMADNGRIVRWEWNFGDGTPVVATTSRTAVSHQYAVKGDYTVGLTVTDELGHKHAFTQKFTGLLGK